MRGVLRDLRFAARLLRRSPGFTVVAVLTLALGIGANTAIFSVVHAVLLQPLPFPEPERLVQVSETRLHLGWNETGFTHANFWDVASSIESFEEVGAITGASFNLTGVDRPRRVTASQVSPGFLRALGVSPLVGRLLEHGEESLEGDHRVTLLSAPLWRTVFGSDPDIVGRTIQLDGEAYRVIGIVPRAEPWLDRADLLVPLLHGAEPNRVSFELGVVARLAPGVSAAAARGELEALARRLERDFPDECHGIGFTTRPSSSWVADSLLRQALWILLGATGLLLLIACVNLANMWLAKAVDRTREAALRAALGAGRSRIVRQWLTESLLLGVLGAAAGVAIALGLVAVLRSIGPTSIPRIDQVAVNSGVLVFTSAITLATSFLSGLAPALQLPRVELAAALREGDRALGGSKGRRLVRDLLVVTEVALSLVLLVGAGLLARSFVSLLGVDRGFETSNRLVASVNLPDSYDSARTREFFESLLGRLNSLPDVRSAAAVNFRPLQGASAGMGIATPENPGIPGETVPWATWRMVTPGYFSTLGLEMLRGRDFDGSDVIGDPWRVVVSRRLAEQLWPGADPLGRTAVLWRGQNERQAEVIGVVEDMRERGLAQDPTLAVYFPYFGAARWPPEIIVRSRVAPLDLVPTIRSVLADIDPDLPLDDVATLGEVVRGSVSNRRLNTSLMGLLAGVALLLALAGVYGVQAYTVARRVPEIGVRMALGARPEQIAGLVMRQGMRPALVGVGLGAILALWLSRLVAGLLFGVSATDLPTFAASAVVILATALLSCYVPARRALRVDPARILRSE